jgi:hypothetical protein
VRQAVSVVSSKNSSESKTCSSSPSAPPPSNIRTLFPSIHSMPRTPSVASTIRIPGTLTPDLRQVGASVIGEDTGKTHLRHRSRALASPATRARVRLASNDGCRYCFLNLCFSRIGTLASESRCVNISFVNFLRGCYRLSFCCVRGGRLQPQPLERFGWNLRSVKRWPSLFRR